MDNDNGGNIFSMVNGGKNGAAPVTETLPQNDYAITDMSGDVFFAHGFCIFTTHHVAVMLDDGKGKGAIPVLVVPLTNVKAVELDEDDDEETLPF